MNTKYDIVPHRIHIHSCAYDEHISRTIRQLQDNAEMQKAEMLIKEAEKDAISYNVEINL